jgi:hypothetical protein
MALRRLTLLALAVLTVAILLEAVAYAAGLLTREMAMALLGIGCALTCLPLIAALQQDRRLERGPR